MSDLIHREVNGTGFSRLMTPAQQDNEQLIIPNLKPFTYYTIYVTAVGASGLSSADGTMIVQRTNATNPEVVELPTGEPTPEPTTDTITIVLPPASFPTGPLKLVLSNSNTVYFHSSTSVQSPMAEYLSL